MLILIKPKDKNLRKCCEPWQQLVAQFNWRKNYFKLLLFNSLDHWRLTSGWRLELRATGAMPAGVSLSTLRCCATYWDCAVKVNSLLPMLELKLLFISLAPWFSWSLGSGEPSFNQGVAEDRWSGSCEGQSKLLDTSELSVAVLPMLSAKAVLGVKAPSSQSLTRLRTLQKLGLGDFDLARTLRLTLMPLFRCWAFLLAKAAVLGLLARRWTLGLLVALGESVGTVKFNDMVPVRWGVLLQRRKKWWRLIVHYQDQLILTQNWLATPRRWEVVKRLWASWKALSW